MRAQHGALFFAYVARCLLAKCGEKSAKKRHPLLWGAFENIVEVLYLDFDRIDGLKDTSSDLVWVTL